MRNLLLFTYLTLAVPNAAYGTTLLYDNTTTASSYLAPFGTLGIGDSVTASSGATFTANDAFVQITNTLLTAGSFNATLDFYNAGAPVGSLIASFNLTGNAIGANSVDNLDFHLNGLTLPQQFVFIVSVTSVVNADLSIAYFGPPGTGSTTADESIVLSGGTFLQLPGPAGTGNPNFKLTSAATPEPSTLLFGSLSLVALAIARKRHQKRKA